MCGNPQKTMNQNGQCNPRSPAWVGKTVLNTDDVSKCLRSPTNHYKTDLQIRVDGGNLNSEKIEDTIPKRGRSSQSAVVDRQRSWKHNFHDPSVSSRYTIYTVKPQTHPYGHLLLPIHFSKLFHEFPKEN